MTDRGRPPSGASFACPFVAFEDDRDGRSDAPDPRHRCFAELRPAPRAIAHQERYCLSPGFAACPTFVDWAQREAARVRRPEPGAADAGAAAADAGLAASSAAFAAGHAEPGAGPHADAAAHAAGARATEWAAEAAQEPEEEPVWPRRAEREWAAPPPWRPETGDAEDRPEDEHAGPPPFLADRTRPVPDWERPDDAAARVAGEAAVGAAAGAGGRPARSRPMSASHDDEREDEGEYEPPMRRFGPGAQDGSDRRGRERARAGSEGAPSWETPRRYEAYPALRPPRTMPSLSPLILAVGALIIGALVLFFIPPLILDLGGSGSSTPTPSVAASPTVASPSTAASQPAASPSAATNIYIVKSGDTMSKIASRFGVGLDALIAANKDTVKDPNKLSIGDRLVIPTPVPSEIAGASPSP